jgi:hypothetical protein
MLRSCSFPGFLTVQIGRVQRNFVVPLWRPMPLDGLQGLNLPQFIPLGRAVPAPPPGVCYIHKQTFNLEKFATVNANSIWL